MRLRLIYRLRAGLPAALLLAVALPCLAQDALSADSGMGVGNGTVPDLKPPSERDTSYRIGVGDVLHISVWEEPQLTEVAVVRPDGMISIPLVSGVTVAGLNPGMAETAITTRLEQYVHKPRVTVIVQEIHSRMVYITGEVERPGAYPLIDSMNVIQLVARSGGVTDYARQGQMYVLRAGSGARIKVDYRKVLKGQRAEQNIDLTPGDTVVVP